MSACKKIRGTVCPHVKIYGVLFIRMWKSMGYYLSACAKMTGYSLSGVLFVRDSLVPSSFARVDNGYHLSLTGVDNGPIFKVTHLSSIVRWTIKSIFTCKTSNWEMSDPANQPTENCPTLQISLTEKCPNWELSVFLIGGQSQYQFTQAVIITTMILSLLLLYYGCN